MNYFSLNFLRGPRPFQWLVKLFLVPCWYVGQTLAPVLDKLDKDWALESSGYFVVAKK